MKLHKRLYKNSCNLSIIFLGLAVIVVSCSTRPETISPSTPTISTAFTETPISLTTLTSTFTPEPTLTSTSALTPTTISTPTPEPTEMGGSDYIYFNLAQNNNVELIGEGIYQYQLSTGTLHQIAGPDYLMIGISPDFQYILAKEPFSKNKTDTTSIYAIHVADGSVSKIVENVLASNVPSYWYPDNRIAFVGWEKESRFIFTVKPDGSELKKITERLLRPLEIYPSSLLEGICWTSGTATISPSYTAFNHTGNWCSTLEGEDTIDSQIPGMYASFSPVNDIFAYSYGSNFSLTITSDGETKSYNASNYKINENAFIDLMQWSPNGENLIIQAIDPSQYDQPLIISSDGLLIKELPMNKYNQSFAWSPDGNQLFQVLDLEKEGQPGSLIQSKILHDLTIQTENSIDENFKEDLIISCPIWGNRSCH